MRAALMVLEHECAHQRHALSLSDPDDPCTPDERRDVEKQCHRAADLPEALSSPPETVDELRERASGMVETAIDFIQYADDQIQVIVLDNDDCLLWTAELPTPRAAWFAIVGMMEVGRG